MADRWLRSLAGAPACDDSRLVWYLGLATVPAGVVGLLAGDFIEDKLADAARYSDDYAAFWCAVGDSRSSDHGNRIWAHPRIDYGHSHWLRTGSGPSARCLTFGRNDDRCVAAGNGSTGFGPFFFPAIDTYYCQCGSAKGLGACEWRCCSRLGVLRAGRARFRAGGLFCIAIFLRLLNKVGFMPFVYYRIVLAAILYVFWLV